MPKFTVTVNRTRTIEYSTEVEVSAKDEESAEEKVEDKINNALTNGKIDTAYEWEESSDDDAFEFEANAA